MPYLDACSFPSFNSTMVRLKGVGWFDGYAWQTVFQFHNGSIKSFFRNFEPLPKKGFNSTMVRLKGQVFSLARILGRCFNSTMVRLKAIEAEGLDPEEHSFNSTMVRLKARRRLRDHLTFSSFNSTMVRLKVNVVFGVDSIGGLVSIPQWFD